MKSFDPIFWILKIKLTEEEGREDRGQEIAEIDNECLEWGESFHSDLAKHI